MLKFTDYRTKTKGLPDLLPYAALVEPGVILNKDGSFTAGWVIRGQDTASSTEKDLSTVSSRFNTARFQVQSATPSPWVLASSKKTS